MTSTDSGPGRPARRPHYRGTHPRAFAERYKELDPARYPAESEKARTRGLTPAGSHLPVLLEEALDVLRAEPGQVVLDATVGHGGHTAALARRILPGGRLVGIDRDGAELTRAVERLAAEGYHLSAHRTNFAGLGKVLEKERLDGFDAVLADLGASSMQLDDSARGFSFKRDGPLDMRMDPSTGPTAAEWLARSGEKEITGALRRWGEEPHAEAVARAIRWAVERGRPPLRTGDLVRLVLEAKGLGARYSKRSPRDLHPAARAFQAFRMAVNDEEGALKQLLRVLPYVLHPRARAAVITFHHVEERAVEEAFHAGLKQGLYSALVPEPIRPTAAEVQENPRARSARLYWAECAE